MSRSDLHYADMSNEINPPKKRGCLFYGFLSLAVIALLVVVVAILGYVLVKRTAEAWARDYTDTTPARLEKVEANNKSLKAEKLDAAGEAKAALTLMSTRSPGLMPNPCKADDQRSQRSKNCP